MEVRSHSTWNRSERREKKRETIRYESDPHSTIQTHTQTHAHFIFALHANATHNSTHWTISILAADDVRACECVCVLIASLAEFKYLVFKSTVPLTLLHFFFLFFVHHFE